ncbi:PREDICTED: chemokine-like factor, partial [Acanthisitta chloris]|uniref:chemokine-like factor n=1 Tax=Acanthisitta chloris TaxID=57068 RepID=UPI0004F0F024
LVALVTFLCFLASRAHGAYAALAGLETGSTLLFLLLYLLKLDLRMSLSDIFNSVIAALSLLIVCLFAIIFKTNNGTLAGGVFGLVLLVLCVADAVLLYKIAIHRPRGRTAPAK